MGTTEPRITFDGTRAAQHGRGAGPALLALPWLLPALALLGAAVGWPLVELVRESLHHYPQLWHEHALRAVALRSGLWAGGVVLVTLGVSLALAQLLRSHFPLRSLARTALIVPWAASVTATAVAFRWALLPGAGAVNVVLHGLGLLRLGSPEAAWLDRPGWALAWMMAVAVFVSVPLTTYVLLWALGQAPDRSGYVGTELEVPWRRFRTVTLPVVWPALLAAALADLASVFNALPIVWEMTRGGPGYRTSIGSSFAFSLRQGGQIGQSAVLSLADVVLVALAVIAFLLVTRGRGEARASLGSREVEGAGESGAGESGAGESGAGVRGGPRPVAATAATLAAVLVTVILLLPYLEMVVGALRPAGQLYAADLIPTHFSLASFRAVWDGGIDHSLLTTVLIAGGATALVMLAAIPAALHAARTGGARRSPIVGLAVAAQLLGPVVLLDGIARAAGRVSVPSSVVLIVVDGAFNLGLAIWILQARFRSLPAELAESAFVDDLPPAGRLVRAKLRPAAGAVLTAVAVTFASAWNELSAALVLTGAGGSAARRPLSVVINDQLGQGSVPWGHVLAAATMLALPTVVLLVLLERQLTKPPGS